MEDLVFYSYLSASAAYLMLLLLSLFSPKKKISLPYLFAVGISLIWAAYITFTQYSPSDDFLISDSLAFETLRNGAWFFVLGTLISRQYFNDSYLLLYKSSFTYTLSAFMLFLFVFEISETARYFIIQIIGTSVQIRLIAHLIFAIIGLALVEQLYRNATAELRWVIKFLCIGLGSLFTVDFIVYSKSLLFTRLDYSLWGARGLINALTVPLLAISMHRLQTANMAVSAYPDRSFFIARY
jgi:hypothetical protein